MLILIFSIILVVGISIAGSCYGHLISTYKKYSSMIADIDATALDIINKSINRYRLKTRIALTDGEFKDAYSIKQDVIFLTNKTAQSKSVADISIASHEFGHALQKNDKSGWLLMDRLLGILSKIANFFIPILLGVALVFVFISEFSHISPILFYVSVGLWTITLLLKLITIPLELDASKRAYNVLKENKLFSKEELRATKKVLNAAALTYVGALFINLYVFTKKIKQLFRRD